LLLFNVLDVRDHNPSKLPSSLDEDSHEMLHSLWEVNQAVNDDNFQECYNDALYYRDEMRELFRRGQANLKERALADNLALAIFEKIAQCVLRSEQAPPELENLPELLADIYYGNFSL